MKRLVAYGLISFATGIGIAGICGRWLQIPWLGQWQQDDPGIALSTAFAVVSLGVGIFILTWNGKPKGNKA